MKKTIEKCHHHGRWRKEWRIMKLFFILTFIGVMQVSAHTYSQTVRLSLTCSDASLKSVMNDIRAQSEFSFFFDDVAVEKIANISLDLKDATIEEVMSACLKGTGFGYRILDKTIILFKEKAKEDDKKKTCIIKGKVVDHENQPLPGVTVLLDSTRIGTVTDTAGCFVLPLPKEKGYLMFSFIGFKPQRVAYTEGKLVTVKMQEDISGLDEVQVIAYGSQRKRNVISAISSVKGEDLQEMPTHSLENLLQGHMAGVEINNISGSPGGGGTVVAIRGYNSLFVEGEGQDRSYGTPLYVVDGIPMQSFTSPVTGANALSNLDPSMIESVEVLKDAASAAIYGSRAGNGVILITTKKGQSGKARFTANVSYSASWLPVAPKQVGGRYERMYHLNALVNTVAPYKTESGEWKLPTSYEEVYNNRYDHGPIYDWFWGGANGPRNAIILQDSLNPFYNNSTNWYKQNYQTAKVINANLQASGGTGNTRYMVGAGYYDEEGIMPNTGFTRFTVLSNLSAQPAKRLRLDSQLGLTYSDRSRGSNAGSSASKFEEITSDPSETPTLLPGSGAFGEAMLKNLNQTSEKNQSYSLRYNMVFDYELIRDLHLKVAAGIDYNQQNQNVFKPSTLDPNTNPAYRFSSSRGTITRDLSILNENLLSYSFNYLEKHNFDIMLGLSFQKDQSYSNGGEGINGPNDKIQYVGDGWGGSNGINQVAPGEELESYASAFSYSSGFSEERMCSYFGRLTYNFKDKYMLEATVRRDGSSVFGEKVRWATFPSVAVGWIFTDEAFMKRFYWLSFGKIRASWGTSGQKFGQRYLAQGVFSASGMFLGNSGMAPNKNGGVINRRLSWEETDQYDIGLDLSFLDYRLKMNLDYYYRYTTGRLSKWDLPGDVYFHTFQWQNAMAISNQGIEIELEADILRETAVKWRMKFNFSRNWNRFEKSTDGYDYGSQVIGKPLNQIRAFKTSGFYDSMEEVPFIYNAQGEKQPLWSGVNTYAVFFPGARRIEDLNGDGKIDINDKYYAASPLPKGHGGFINEIRWKNFDLNIMFNYSIGRHAVAIYDDFCLAPREESGPLFVGLKDLKTWTGAGSKADYPKAQKYVYLENQYVGVYDEDIETVHFVRLKQLTLGYNVGDGVCKKIGLGGIRAFITAENLFLLTNYSGIDPELIDITSGQDNLRSYPLPRKFTIGLTVNF